MHWQKILNYVVDKVKITLQKNPTCRIGLAGGKTPRPLYKLLAQQKFPWHRIELIQIDERYVPETDERSNFRMQNEGLFSHIKIPKANIYRFNTSLPSGESVLDMQKRLKKLRSQRKNGEPLFDILILGMGKDGHIASLFPHSEGLDSKMLATVTESKNFDVSIRLTLTFKALLDTSEAVIVMRHDREKEKLFSKITKERKDYHEIPVQKIITGMPTKIFMNS